MQGYTSQIGHVELDKPYTGLDLSRVDANAVRCPDEKLAREMEDLIREVKAEGDSIGGVVSCVIRGIPAGVGEPVFDRFQARLGYYMMGINAAKGFEYGEGFRAAAMRGSEHNDVFTMADGRVKPQTNHAGGILGGITSGEDVYLSLIHI